MADTLPAAAPAVLSPFVQDERYDRRLDVQGSGPTLVLIPGMDGTGQLFYRQVPLLARRFRVVTYRLRDDATSMESLVDDLAVVLRDAAPSDAPAIVVGESFGGALAMSFALARPTLVRALVVLNSFPHFQPQFRLHLALAGLRVLPWGAMPLVRRFTAVRMHSRHTHGAEIERFLTATRATTRHGYLNRLRVLTQYDVRDRLRDIAAPTLFLAADRDHLVPSVQQATYMSARVPGAALRVLDGHGHICLIAPDVDLNEILHEWRPELM